MMMRMLMSKLFSQSPRRAAACAALLILPWGHALADEVRVLAAGAAKHALERIAPAFEAATGHRVRAAYDTVGAQRDRVLREPRGAAADLVILSDAALRALGEAQRLLSQPPIPVGQVVVAIAVPSGAAAPDLDTPQAMRQALLSAPQIAYADPARGATAGTHFAKVLDALGIRTELEPRTVMLSFGVDVIQGVKEGRFALGVSQSSEILQHDGVRYAGALPAPYGLATAYGMALASDSGAAKALLEFLRTPQAQVQWRASGFVPIP